MTDVRHRGFAMLTAIGIMAVIGVMLLVVGLMLASDGRRTIDGARDAQLRQMLLAGAAHVTGGRVPPSTQPVTLPIPPNLEQAGASLTLRLASTTQPIAQVSVVATMDGKAMRQTLTLESDNEQARITEAVMEPTVRVPVPPATRPATQPSRL